MKACFIFLLGLVLAAGSAQAGILTPGLEAQLEGLADTDVLKVLVVLEGGADTYGLDKSLHERKRPLAERHSVIVSELQAAAAATQGNLLTDLTARRADKTLGGVVGFTPHWIVNGIVVVAEVRVIREIALRSDVSHVEPELMVELITPVLEKTAVAPGDQSSKQGVAAQGVALVKAPQVWYELGITGAGRLVAGIDSGVDADHPALNGRWRGNFATAAESWRDDAGLGYPDYPADAHGHGTHTMGTMCGATAADTIGVAPGAQWIASNAISVAGDVDIPVLAAFEFMTDPDGNPNTTADVPDVVQNSWGVFSGPGSPYLPCDSTYWEAIDNCEAAGVVVVWSAGNEGPGPGTLRSPGNRATTPTNCFSVGSVDNTTRNVSNFSSRGPSQCGGEYQIKPEIMGPGENVLSAAPGGGYAYMDGTSMAGPHVAGIVALMREANPDLDVTDIKEILMETATDIGEPGDDNDSGHGMVNAYLAVLASLADLGHIQGTVTSVETGLPLEGVEVRRPRRPPVLTDAAGFFRLDMRAGPVTLEFGLFGFATETDAVQLAAGETIDLSVSLTPLPTAVVSGTVTGPDATPVVGATVAPVGIPLPAVTTDSAGYYALPLPQDADAAYELIASADDLAYVTQFFGLPGDLTIDIQLPHILGEGFESGGFLSYPWRMVGDLPPVISAAQPDEGFFSARSGAIRDSEFSGLELDYYVAGAGEISFQVKVDSEAGYDYLGFFVDGQLRHYWTGQVPWTEHRQLLERGQHLLSWRYAKDSSITVGQDAAWVDRIEFPGTGLQAMPRLDWNPQPMAMALNPGLRDSVAMNLTNGGGYRLDYTARILPYPVSPGVTLADLLESDHASLLHDGHLMAGAKSAAAEAWAVVRPQSGWVQPGTSRELTVVFDGAAATDGLHYALLELQTNDPAVPVATVPLVFTVGGVSDVPADGLPARPRLLGAAPNPFNPMTRITYDLPRDARVELVIYDVSGRRVRTLIDAMRPAGRHRETWQGRDDSGRSVASGTYYVQMRVAGDHQVSPLLLLR